MDRAYRRIMLELLDDVVSGKLKAADWLPRADDIAAAHACSPSAAREAVRALEERGVVEVIAGQGQQVRTSDHWIVLDRDVAEAVLVRHRDKALLSEAVAALRLVEPKVGMLAARRITRGDLTTLENALERMRSYVESGNGAADAAATFVDADANFHRTTILVGGNRFLANALASLQAALALARHQEAPDRDTAVVRLNETILAALTARDATATAAAIDDYCRLLGSWLRV